MSDAQYYNTLPYAGGKKQGARDSQNERPLTIDLVSSRYANFCPSPVPMDMETAANTSMNSAQARHFSPPSFRRMIPQSIALEMSSPTGPFRQYSVSPITVENDQYFSYPNMAAMGMTFMPCVCMPDFSVSENGKSKKACRRCSITPVKKSGSSTVAIDNKIEQAMDLVKSHLMFAVREEVEVLKEQIAELIERNNQLEHENGILRAAASPETLAKLAQPPPSSSS
ncbi:uncharacterized protein LOC127833606 isoform X2 [Dreissena polymorpha]|uniref:uncharacterized protein LOC127833606 isoform X2 n=1 Tax=Dreissena polymorpha TaxID=45954 RepID=UPI00226509AD|nr:uncharacterized protein LOC127833606 isoform X2 [Dreissena polymorpha]XP_052214924.1 uncharacterized protein LOC127833606 isoform X2 [Dreissena polymorpha]